MEGPRRDGASRVRGGDRPRGGASRVARHVRALPRALGGAARVGRVRGIPPRVPRARGTRARGIPSSSAPGHDNPLNVFSPGQLLLVRPLEAAARRGDPEYDFSLGEEAYKEAWASSTRGVFRVLRWRRGVRSALEARAR